MKKPLLAFGIILLAVASFFVGSLVRRDPGGRGPVLPASPESAPAVETAASASPAPGTVAISPEKQQLIGIRVAEVKREPVAHELRVLGRVAVDDTRLYIVNAATSGWVVRISDVTPGALVKKGDILATFYAPELLGAQQAYLYALNTLDRLKERSDTPPPQYDATQVSIKQARDQLVNLGMGDAQMDGIAKSRERVQQVDMIAPTTGIVIERNIFSGLKFVQGTEFFRIADLSRVWILLDVFEDETKFLQPGARTKVSLAGRPLVFEAVVSRVLPLFDPESRTMKVRLEADNPGYALRPDMFVDVELPVSLPPTLAVPADAILDSGLKKTVFVDRGGGAFEPREVETGLKLGRLVEVLRGLEPGERIVVSGTFLVDSESRMELAAEGIAETLARDPVCGVAVSVRLAEKAGRKSLFEGRAYYFHSDECKAAFDREPAKYAGRSPDGGPRPDPPPPSPPPGPGPEGPPA